MSKKKAYVSPKVTRVKMEPSQAVLSQCSVGVTNLSDSTVGVCSASKNCKLKTHGSGDNASTS